jgi:glycosyltransferase involved in cell wall biosynthesis
MLNNITLLIKTFERPKSVKKLLRSITNLYSTVKVIIVDDSKVAMSEEDLLAIHCNLKYFHVGYDVGLSKGRNIGVSKVDTDYFVLLDDDFFFTKDTNLTKLLSYIQNHTLDMVGFDFFDYGYCKRNFQGVYSVVDGTLNRVINKHKYSLDDVKFYDFILNCFIGRTDFFNTHKWDEEIKIGSEHDDFFYNLKKFNPKISHIDSVSIAHYPEYTKEYKSFRKGRFDHFYQMFLKKHNLLDVQNKGDIYGKFDLLLIKMFALLGRIKLILRINE